MSEPSWTPRRRGALYCSPACGGRCTLAAWRSANAAAGALASRLGPTWVPVVVENLGWRYGAGVALPRGGPAGLDARLEVRANVVDGLLRGYTAFLGGGYSEAAPTPETALRRCVRRAEADLAALATLLRRVPSRLRRVPPALLGDLLVAVTPRSR